MTGNLKAVVDVEERPMDFLSMMRAMYARIPDGDNDCRSYFKNVAAQLPKPNLMSKPMRELFDECIFDGGSLATDLVCALCSDYHSQLRSLRSDPDKMVQDALNMLETVQSQQKLAKQLFKYLNSKMKEQTERDL